MRRAPAALGVLLALAAGATGADTGIEEALRAEIGHEPRIWQAVSSRYRIHLWSSESRQEAAGVPAPERLQRILDSLEEAYRHAWGTCVALSEPRPLIRVHVLGDVATLRRVMQRSGMRQPGFETGGFHLPGEGLLVVARESLLERVLEANLVHEAAHMLNRELLGGEAISPWLNEGLAQMSMFSAIEEPGHVRLGRLDEGSRIRVPVEPSSPGGDDEVVYQFAPLRSVSYLFGQLSRDPGLSLGPMLRIRTAGDFYGARAQLYYAQSWTLLHLLMEGRLRKTGPMRPALCRYLALDREGHGGEAALLGALGTTIEDLDSAWYRHLRKLR
ncbi:MAG TPA: hypothetical protein VFP98_03330 [Candidatus Polarisedimenticolia bacterium]|nr:hypothetical protein [Candidatus Polarisedimenticolia bacterium]